MTIEDLRSIIDVMVALAVTEVIAKPVASRVGRSLLRWLDGHVDWVPDWLHSKQDL